MNHSHSIGKAVLRKEDPRLLKGAGCYSDDVNLPDQAHAAMVRSPYAHARIISIDSSDARSMPGVLAVLTGRDCVADGLHSIPHNTTPIKLTDIVLENRDGSKHYVAPHFLLPADKARFVGEPVAMVVANTIEAAKDASECVCVEYEPLAAVTATRDAIKPDAPRIWDEAASNQCIDADVGNAAATEAAFRNAKYVVRLKSWVGRVAGVPIEPRAAVGSYDAQSRRYTLHAGSGGVVRQKRELAGILGVPEDEVRVVSGDVGGNFGTRGSFYPEFGLLVWAAKRIGRPVKWKCERQEAFLSDYQGRDLLVEAELALDAHGKFLGLRGSNVSNVGAHSVSYVPLTKGVELMSSVYQIPAAHFRARAFLSNTPPTAPYRSAGRPEAIFVIERLIDKAAAEHSFDRIEIRRKNLVPESAMPFANPLGMTYDSGAYEKVMDAALALGDWQGFALRRAESRGHGRLRGIGVGNYVEATSGMPRERAEITVYPEGNVQIVIGTLSAGQGHDTSFAQLVTEWLGVPFDCVQLITGDTDKVLVGGGSHSGRSMRFAGIVIGKASNEIIEKGKRIAAHVFESATADIEFTNGRFTVKGTDRSVGIFDIAAFALERAELAEDLRGPLAAVCDETVRVPAFPFGSHVCEVEIDPETGFVEIVRYSAVDDVGRAVNPLIVDGQIHGGIAQGVGQALFERCYYDSETGQLMSASFMDYSIPRADNLPSFMTLISEVPSPTNPLGIRAAGEGGTTPALAVVVNAIVDALSEFGVKHIEMPVTPENIWRVIRAARLAKRVSV